MASSSSSLGYPRPSSISSSPITSSSFLPSSSTSSSSAVGVSSTNSAVVGSVGVPVAAADVPSTSGAVGGFADVPAVNNRVQVLRQGFPATDDDVAAPAVNIRAWARQQRQRQQSGDGGAALARELSRGRRRADDAAAFLAQRRAARDRARAAMVGQRMETLLQFSHFWTQVYQLRYGLLPAHAMPASLSFSPGSTTTSWVDTSSSVGSNSSSDPTWSESMWCPADPSDSDQDRFDAEDDGEMDADADADADADSFQYYEPRYGPKRARKD